MDRSAHSLAGLAPASYAYAASAGPSSRLVFSAGACPLSPDGAVAGASFAEQALLALHNLGRALDAQGAAFADIVHLRVLVASADRHDLVEVWDALIGVVQEPAPPSTLMGVTVLGYPGQLVELEAVAAVEGEL
jgi:enamine deaminase RidA (YjgF/YER057c/UK114 family)